MIVRLKICIYSHFSIERTIPHYVQTYVRELENYFDQILLVYNERPLETIISSTKVRLMPVQNEGYDLGMYYKAFKTLPWQEYESIACINDSNVVFGSLKKIFDWGQDLPFWGLMDSTLRPSYSTHEDEHHIQSHFLVFNAEGLRVLAKFMDQLKIEKYTQEKDPKKLKRLVINDWEIGLSQYMRTIGISPKSYVSEEEIKAELGIQKPINMALKLYPYLIKQGLPIIKKRVIISWQWQHIMQSGIKLVRRFSQPADETLVRELKGMRCGYLVGKVWGGKWLYLRLQGIEFSKNP